MTIARAGLPEDIAERRGFYRPGHHWNSARVGSELAAQLVLRAAADHKLYAAPVRRVLRFADPEAELVTVILGPLVVVVVIGATDLWVYRDAKRCADEGAPVVLRAGRLVVSTPAAWLLGCVILWVVFFPTYMISRSR